MVVEAGCRVAVEDRLAVAQQVDLGPRDDGLLLEAVDQADEPIVASVEVLQVPGAVVKLDFVVAEHVGRIVEVLGDLESSRHVAVVIPGVGNGIANYERGLRHSAASLHDDAGRSDVTVIAWLGYDTPDDLLAATARRPVVAADSLSRLLAGLDLSTDQSLHVTVIGHSYGSLVAGEALQAGARTNEVVFIGSPGVGADHVSELGLPASTRVWAGRAGSDPIGLARGFECLDPLPVCYPAADRLFFGVDPTDPAFGATAFVVDDAPFREAHSSYFKQDSVSLHNLSSILLGQSHQVIRPGS